MEKNKEWLKKEVEDYLAIEGVYDARTALKAVLEYIDQLDEPNEMELSEPSAWKTIAKLYHPNEVYWGNVRDSYVESLEEQDKVVIPQFVGDWLRCVKNTDITLYGAMDNEFLNTQELTRWMTDAKNQLKFARAWLDGYTVEKEKRYYVYDKATKSYLGYNAVRTQLNWWTSRLENESFTEQEIKAIDERYLAFKVEVTE